jgi:hypothetical protein
VNEDATPVEVLLELSDDQKAALDTELACLKAQLPVIRAINDAPSFERRQTIISGVIKHVRGLRIFASSKNEPERFAREDICFAAGTFPEGFSDRHSEADDLAFVWRWFEQAQTCMAMLCAQSRQRQPPETQSIQSALVARVLQCTQVRLLNIVQTFLTYSFAV